MRRQVVRLAVWSAFVVACPTVGWAQVEEPADEPLAETAPSENEAIVAEERHMSAEAEEEAAADDPVELRYRLWGTALDRPSFDDDASVAEDNQRAALYQQIRGDVNVEFSSFGLRLETDIASGRLAGEPRPDVPAEFLPAGAAPDGTAIQTENLLDPRNVYAQYQSLVLLRVGLQTSNYGLGIVANDGVEDHWDLFNYEYGGDRVLRGMLGARPFALMQNRVLKHITFVIGGDVVYRDDNASYLEGDRAYQAVTSLFYRDADPTNPDNASFLGTYVAYRSQEDASGDDLDVLALDLAGRRSLTTDDDRWLFSLGAETALVTGETTRTFPSTGGSETDVLGLGAVGEGSVRWNPMLVTLRLKTGYASGDANPDDDTLYRFRFDPNYKVGLVLFDHYLPAATRAAYERVADPTRAGQPPKGVHGLISDGAVENTIFLNPQLLFGEPEGLLTGVGVLWAYAAQPLMDPFNSFANGGAPTGPRGAVASRDLGLEVDVAARYRYPIVSQLKLEVKAEYGILFPGDAFDDALGNNAAPQNLVRGRFALLW